jgi:hypothetical protein
MECCEDVRSFVGLWGVRATTVPRIGPRRDGVDVTESRSGPRERFRERVVENGGVVTRIAVAERNQRTIVTACPMRKPEPMEASFYPQ